jgi:ATP-binding cassette subfamily B protein
MAGGFSTISCGSQYWFFFNRPYHFGKLVNLATYHQSVKELGNNDFFFSNITIPGNHGKPVVLYGVVWLLIASISVAMISRIQSFSGLFFKPHHTKVYRLTIFTEGLQHAMKLPYQEFEDARSGETSILQKVRIDTEKFVTSFINVLFPVLVGIVFVAVYATSIHWSLPLVYFGGIFFLPLFQIY